MSDTCATHRSRVPRRSSGRIKGGATTVEDERGPGLDFNLCFVCGSRPWGAAALLLCLFMLLKYFECSPVPASFFPFYELCYILKDPFWTYLLRKYQFSVRDAKDSICQASVHTIPLHNHLVTNVSPANILIPLLSQGVSLPTTLWLPQECRITIYHHESLNLLKP